MHRSMNVKFKYNNVLRVVVASFGLMQKPSNFFFVPAPF